MGQASFEGVDFRALNLFNLGKIWISEGRMKNQHTVGWLMTKGTLQRGTWGICLLEWPLIYTVGRQSFLGPAHVEVHL